MPDPSSEADCTYTTLPIEFSILNLKGHYHQVPIFTEWLPYLGQIAFLWGSFERKWNDFLEMMFLATGTLPDSDWKGRRGKKRRRLFSAQVDKTFDISTHLNLFLHSIVENSVTIQAKRNAMMHGEVSTIMGPDPRMVVDGIDSDGNPEQYIYREKDVKRLFYEISYLRGCFIPLFPPFPFSPLLSSEDKLILQALWSKAHPNWTTPTKLERPHQA